MAQYAVLFFLKGHPRGNGECQNIQITFLRYHKSDAQNASFRNIGDMRTKLRVRREIQEIRRKDHRNNRQYQIRSSFTDSQPIRSADSVIRRITRLAKLPY